MFEVGKKYKHTQGNTIHICVFVGNVQSAVLVSEKTDNETYVQYNELWKEIKPKVKYYAVVWRWHSAQKRGNQPQNSQWYTDKQAITLKQYREFAQYEVLKELEIEIEE